MREDGEVMVMEVDDAAPCEIIAGETRKMAAVQMVDLIEQSYGTEAAEKFATGTPMDGMPQLAEEPVAEAIVEAAPIEIAPHREISRPIMRHSRLADVALGGVVAMIAMIAWYCATQL
jgi:hypothetical protein